MQITFRVDYNSDQAYNAEARTRKAIEKTAFDKTFPELMEFISDFFKESLCKGYTYKLSFSKPTEIILGKDRFGVLESIMRTQNLLATKKKSSLAKVLK